MSVLNQITRACLEWNRQTQTTRADVICIIGAQKFEALLQEIHLVVPVVVDGTITRAGYEPLDDSIEVDAMRALVPVEPKKNRGSYITRGMKPLTLNSIIGPVKFCTVDADILEIVSSKETY